MLLCDCLSQIMPFALNLLEMNRTFSILLGGAHFLDENCEEVLNHKGTATAN